MHLRIKSYRSQLGRWGAFSLLSNSATVLEAELEGTNWACSRKAPIFVLFTVGLSSTQPACARCEKSTICCTDRQETTERRGRDHPAKMHVSGHEKLRHKAKRSTPTSALCTQILGKILLVASLER